MDDLLNGERPVLVPNAAGMVCHKRFRLRDPRVVGEVRELDCWVGTREAWAASPFAGALGWAVDALPGGQVIALRFE